MILVGAALLACCTASSVVAQERTEPRPLAGNPAPQYPKKAEREGLAGPVAFLAKVSAEGLVTSLRILRVPEENYGFEQATRTAVMRWRFEPARLGDEAVAGLFAGVVKFALRPEDEADLAEIAHTAFERWQRPKELDRLEGAPRAKIHDESATPTEAIERRLAESFEASRATGQFLSVDAIRFEGDIAWMTTTLRLSGDASSLPFRTLAVRRSRRWYAFLVEIPHDPEAPIPKSESYDVDPVPISRPGDPPYPGKAKDEGVSGNVVLYIQVELDGSTTVLRVVESLPYCTLPAVESAWKWRWKPGLRDERPVPARGMITVSFTL